MIFDGPKHFRRSIVKWAKFREFELQQLFAALREKEEVLQKDLGSERDFSVGIVNCLTSRDDMVRAAFALGRLHEVQSQLAWMACNVTGSRAEVERRRRGFGGDKELLVEEERECMDAFERMRLALSEVVKR